MATQFGGAAADTGALLPDTGVDGAVEAAEKLRTAIGRLTLRGIDRPVTASVGAAVYPHTAVDAESLLRLADRALYVAKASGRDRSKLADTLVGAVASSVPQPPPQRARQVA